MFKLTVVSAFVLASLSASAAEQTVLPTNVIAQVRTMGGFGPPQVRDFGVRVFADGTVVAFNRSANPQQVLMAQLTPAKLADLRAAADQLRLSRLVALDANQPPCMDAPATEYAVNTTRAGGLVIARTVSCQRFEDQSSPSASQLLEALKGLQALDGLKFRF
jgi:hypothetical protein